MQNITNYDIFNLHMARVVGVGPGGIGGAKEWCVLKSALNWDF